MRTERTRRRDRGSGCIRMRNDGRWEGRLTFEMSEPIYVYGKTKKTVQDKLFALRQEPNQIRDPERLTVSQWLDRWLQSVNENPRLRLATYKLYKNAVDKHIVPHIGNIRLTRLSKADVYDLLDKLARNGIRDRTRQLVHSTLHGAIQAALKREKVSRNVVALVDKPPAAKKPPALLRTDEEVLRFRQAIVGSQYEVLYLTALDTGLRQGELLALTWDCVDLTGGYIHVKATLTENEAGELAATPPKTTSSIRTVKLLKTTSKMLRTYQKREMASKRGLSVWVFPNWDGGPMRKDGYVRRELPRLVKKVGLPPITFHGLRHTHATMLAARGVNVKATQERLGHSTTRMTLDVYSHATATMQDQAVAALDAFYEGVERGQDDVSGQLSGQTEKTGHAQEN